MELNVIYTPGAVRYMAFFALSLLEHSDCQVRLVSNGCDAAERRLLAQLADSQVDMSYHEIPCPQMLAHHDALKHLHALSDGDFFCFVDSDLLATGPFMDELLPLIEDQVRTHHPTLYWSEGGLTGEWAVRHGDWKLHADKARHELFHLGRDPAEKTNLAHKQPARLKELAALYDTWLDQMAKPIGRSAKRWDPDQPTLSKRERARLKKRQERKKKRAAEKKKRKSKTPSRD